MQGENKTKKNTNTVFRLLQRPRGSAFQKDTSGLSMPILCDFWWSYFRCLAEAVFQERESVRQGMSIFLMAPCSKHRRKQSSLFPLGTITAWFQEASQDEFSTPVKAGWLSVKLRVFQYNSTETLNNCICSGFTCVFKQVALPQFFIVWMQLESQGKGPVFCPFFVFFLLLPLRRFSRIAVKKAATGT